MEPARSTDEFSRRITIADANNIVTVLDLATINSKYQAFEEDYVVEFQCALEDIKCTVGLLSLAEAPFPDTNALASEAQQNAEIAKVRTEGQKIALGLYTAKGNAPWVYKARVVLQNQGGDENHVPIMVPFLSTNETALVGGNFKLGVKIEPIWNQPLKAQDYLVICGTYKQVVSFSSKKKDNLEAFKADIEGLKLAIYGRLTDLPANILLGRNTGTGVVEQIAQSTFAKLSEITVVTDAIISDAPSNLNTLDKLAAAIGDDNNFITTVANALGAKAPLVNPTFSGSVNLGEGHLVFPVVQNPSTNTRTLDDYQEGTFIPSVIGLTEAGTCTYAFRTGHFTKIGKLVDIKIFVEWSAHTGTGFMSLTGLPFMAAVTVPLFTWHRNLALTANYTFQCYCAANSSVVVLRQIPVGGGVEANIALDPAAGFMLSGSYLAAA